MTALANERQRGADAEAHAAGQVRLVVLGQVVVHALLQAVTHGVLLVYSELLVIRWQINVLPVLGPTHTQIPEFGGIPLGKLLVRHESLGLCVFQAMPQRGVGPLVEVDGDAVLGLVPRVPRDHHNMPRIVAELVSDMLGYLAHVAVQPHPVVPKHMHEPLSSRPQQRHARLLQHIFLRQILEASEAFNLRKAFDGNSPLGRNLPVPKVVRMDLALQYLHPRSRFNEERGLRRCSHLNVERRDFSKRGSIKGICGRGEGGAPMLSTEPLGSSLDRSLRKMSK
mmetsp:Transcript_62150/g.166771  ORF Transcript_62150/g.166771 Transcript_62150/m.166771 type:complete len:282 (+) Transcript_62150:1180-2025(+)